ncbi:hypothetical protein ATANTOWER_000402 [Ataeniobius toweri]|uniref:Uncharacterized protein n=1 Tax=Ataeniobius toweri TaxID=208326 RepID=A0ABU7BZK7_9TELE|nr:hypothetical protein [Ataeniobius toweri]
MRKARRQPPFPLLCEVMEERCSKVLAVPVKGNILYISGVRLRIEPYHQVTPTGQQLTPLGVVPHDSFGTCSIQECQCF